MSSRDRRTRMIAIGTVLLLVVGLVGALAAVVGGTDGDGGTTTGDSPVLSLSRTSNVGTLTAGSSTSWTLGAALPAGDPGDGVVVDPSASTVTEAQVRTLLDALGLDAEPRQVDGGWTARGRVHGERAAFALDETAGNVWQYARGDLADCLAVQPGASPDASTSCTTTNDATSTTKQAGPGRAALDHAAKNLFETIGVTPGKGLRAHEDGADSTVLDVPLTVEGLPVVDVALSVAVDEHGISSASGWYEPSFAPLGEYPLVTAAEGLTRLQAEPVPEIATACATGTSCPSPTPAPVTGARLAWLTSRDGDRTVLVPAWQFEADGYYGPAVVAVDAAHLG